MMISKLYRLRFGLSLLVLFSTVATAQNANNVYPLTCTLEANGIPSQPIPVAYDGMQKVFELPFLVTENEPGRFTFYRITPEAVMAFYRRTQELSRTANHIPDGKVPIYSALMGKVRDYRLQHKIDLIFQVAEVKLFSEGGEITPSTVMRTTLKDARNWGLTEEVMNMREQQVRRCEPVALRMRYLRFDKKIGQLPATIRCQCGGQPAARAD